MTENANPMSIAYWRAWDRRKRPPMGPGAWFVWHQVIPRSPLMGDLGSWLWCADGTEAIGCIRHVALPEAAGDWLARKDWDAHPRDTIAIEELLGRARLAPQAVEHKEQRSAFQELAHMLDAIAQLPACEQGTALSAFAKQYNALFATGPYAAYQIRVVEGVVAYVKVALGELKDEWDPGDFQEETGHTPAQWRAIARRVGTDPAAQAEIERLMEQCGQY